jgi:hypothetical protein
MIGRLVVVLVLVLVVLAAVIHKAHDRYTIPGHEYFLASDEIDIQ